MQTCHNLQAAALHNTPQQTHRWGNAHLCTCDSAIGRCTGKDWEAWKERKNRDHHKSKRTGSGEADSMERQAANLHQTVPDRPRAQHKAKQPFNDRPPACIKQEHLNCVCRTALCSCPALSHAHPYTRNPSPVPPPHPTHTSFPRQLLPYRQRSVSRILPVLFRSRSGVPFSNTPPS